MSTGSVYSISSVATNADHDSGEIDLIALVEALWARRLVVFLVFTCVIAVAALYLFLSTPLYQSSIIIKKAENHELTNVNIPGIFSLSSDAALSRVGDRLGSFEARYQFFKGHKDLYSFKIPETLSLEQIYERFDKGSFLLTKPDPKKNNDVVSYGVTLNYREPTLGVEILRKLVAWVQTSELKAIENDIRQVIESKLEQQRLALIEARKEYGVAKDVRIAKLLEADRVKRQQLIDERAAIKTELAARRKNRIKVLNEAIIVAGSLGIETPTVPSSIQKVSTSQGNTIKTEVNNVAPPLYFRGVLALTSERDVLLARKNDEFTEPRLIQIEKELTLLEKNREVESLRERSSGNEDIYLNDISKLEKSIARLKAIKIDFSNVKLMKIDRNAIAPTASIKPRKALILAVAGVLGIVLGLFAALVLNMLHSVKKRGSSPDIVPLAPTDEMSGLSR